VSPLIRVIPRRLTVPAPAGLDGGNGPSGRVTLETVLAGTAYRQVIPGIDAPDRRRAAHSAARPSSLAAAVERAVGKGPNGLVAAYTVVVDTPARRLI